MCARTFWALLRRVWGYKGTCTASIDSLDCAQAQLCETASLRSLTPAEPHASVPKHTKLLMSSDAQKTTTAVDPALLEQCGCKRERLSNACHYSFQDLYRAKCAALGQAGDDAADACAALYKRDRDAINETVREWAEAAGWETEMHHGSDGQEYRAFAPEAPS